MNSTSLTPPLLLLTLSLPLRAEVFSVSSSGGADFSNLQAAVNAAQSGDTLRIRSGTYEGFHCEGKALVLSAEEGEIVTVESSSTIENVPEGEVFVVQGIDFQGRYSSTNPALDHGSAIRVVGGLGGLRIEDCTAWGDPNYTGPGASDGPAGLDGITDGSIALVETDLRGGPASGAGVSSGAGLQLSGTGLAVFQTTMTGAIGSFPGGFSYGTSGGRGGQFSGPLLFLLDSSATGGEGASAVGFCEFGGAGGDGFRSSGSVPRLRDSIFAGGSGGSCSPCQLVTDVCGFEDQPPSGTAFASVLPPIPAAGSRVRFQVPRCADQDATWTLDTEGPAGGNVWAVISDQPDFVLNTAHHSPLLVRAGAALLDPEWNYLGLADGQGQLAVSRVAPAVGEGRTSYPLFVQVISISPAGVWSFGPVRTMTIEAAPAGEVFCFGDGADPAGCSDCSCGNNAPAGSRGGCRNSSGRSARLRAFGSASLSNETLRFDLSGANPSVSARLASADNALPLLGPCAAGSGISPSPGLDGFRCIGGNVKRHGIRNTDLDGRLFNPWGGPSATPPSGFAAQGGFAAGQTRHFQAFYRENPTFACGLSQNTSNGVTIQFVP